VAKAITRSKPRPVRPELPASKFTHPAITPAPAPRPAVPPRPCGDFDRASIAAIQDAARRTWTGIDTHSRVWSRGVGIGQLLTYLEQFPGRTWQERFEASGLNDRGNPVRDLHLGDHPRSYLTAALGALFCLRVLQPRLEAFRSNKFTEYWKSFRLVQADPALDRCLDAIAQSEATRHWKNRAFFDVCTALTTQGIAFADLTPEAFLHYAVDTRNLAMAAYSYSMHVGHLAWQVMHEIDHFDASIPSTLRAAMRNPKLTPRQLVERQQLKNYDVAELLIQYLERRSLDFDYSSLLSLSFLLAGNFWKQIETINPGQAGLQLEEPTYLAWRRAIAVREDGKPRRHIDAILTEVRAFYYDIQAWAGHEPERWAHWVAPCPIPHGEIRAGNRRRQRSREEMHDRIRRLQPLLPALVRYVEEEHETMRVLAEAADTEAGEKMTVGARVFKRLFTPADQRHARMHGTANVRYLEEATGKAVNATLAEDTAFWQWAVVEALRLTGVRIEELLELSQLSIRQYRRPNGEVVALLVIAPSKSDRERVIPVSAELFHVLACIIRRISGGSATVPLSTRYDEHERITTEPQPFLFQRRIGQRNEVMSTGAVRAMLERVCTKIAANDPRFVDDKFTPHDFRRLFATDVVNNGLPIHIGAALLGHLNLETTRGYVAVFNEDVVRHYQAHLARRRAMRPEEEYRPITDTEWEEFEEHFDKRKLELGNCGRPYATPCNHEHACIRCPMLQVDPRMIPRLDEIEADLKRRRKRAADEGWIGEIEGIDLTLSFLDSKRSEAIRWDRRRIPLEIPSAKSRGR
jgi:site-specific recombinase XerD